METTPKFQNYITRLTEKHGFHLNKPLQHLQLEMEGMEDSWPLIIQRSERNTLSVYYHIESEWGDIEQDSAVTFFTGYGQWVPMQFTPLNAHFRDCCRPTDRDFSNIKVIDPQACAEVAAFCENWADELQAQGWLENARVWLGD